MKRQNGKGDVRTSASKPGNSAAHTSTGGGVEYRPVGLEVAEQDVNRVRGCTALSYLLLRDDGWLRVTPSRDRKTVYFKWKFTHGKWANHYVMTVYETWQWDLAIENLQEKCCQVDMGARVPTLDTWFNGHRDGVPVD